jgi:hypothetical protein
VFFYSIKCLESVDEGKIILISTRNSSDHEWRTCSDILKAVFKVSCFVSVDMSSLVIGNSIKGTILVTVMMLYK